MSRVDVLRTRAKNLRTNADALESDSKNDPPRHREAALKQCEEMRAEATTIDMQANELSNEGL